MCIGQTKNNVAKLLVVLRIKKEKEKKKASGTVRIFFWGRFRVYLNKPKEYSLYIYRLKSLKRHFYFLNGNRLTLLLFSCSLAARPSLQLCSTARRCSEKDTGSLPMCLVYFEESYYIFMTMFAFSLGKILAPLFIVYNSRVVIGRVSFLLHGRIMDNIMSFYLVQKLLFHLRVKVIGHFIDFDC